MDMTYNEKRKFSPRRYRWLLYLTNAYYNGALDILNLCITTLIVVSNTHLIVGEINED